MDFNFDYKTYSERLQKAKDKEVLTDWQMVQAALEVDNCTDCLFIDVLMQLEVALIDEIVKRYGKYVTNKKSNVVAFNTQST